MPSNPWRHLPASAPFVLPEDEPFVHEHNANQVVENGMKGEHLLDLTLPPGPFQGFFDAPVVVLLANPGHHPDDHEMFSGGTIHNLLVKAATSDEGTPIVGLTEVFRRAGGEQWWANHTRDLAEAVGGFDTLSEIMLAVELHGYHSQAWTSPLHNFPSQSFGFDLVKRAMDREALIITVRCQKNWFASVPGLRNYDNLIGGLKSQRSAHLSHNNLGEENFTRVVSHLKRGH